MSKLKQIASVLTFWLLIYTAFYTDISYISAISEGLIIGATVVIILISIIVSAIYHLAPEHELQTLAKSLKSTDITLPIISIIGSAALLFYAEAMFLGAIILIHNLYNLYTIYRIKRKYHGDTP